MERRFHNIAISVLMSFAVWMLVDMYFIAITFWQFVILEIIIGLGEFFSIFVKKKFGLLNPEDVKYLNNNKDQSEDGLQ